jgi:hypothetical protein
MRTLIPSSDDDVNEEFFAAWFESWSNLRDDVEPEDDYATYCAF